jgi:hypothetical protein
MRRDELEKISFAQFRNIRIDRSWARLVLKNRHLIDHHEMGNITGLSAERTTEGDVVYVKISVNHLGHPREVVFPINQNSTIERSETLIKVNYQHGTLYLRRKKRKRRR